jgi:hypothetical protein
MARLPIPHLVALVVALGPVAAPATASTPAEDAYRAAAHLARSIGPRPAGSPAERAAHAYVAARFRAAGLRVGHDHFAVPGHGSSRNVVGVFDTPAHCLIVLMAHTDSFVGPGAVDNASGVGVLVALAPRLAARARCDTWLVATGAEERGFTGQPDHLGALALVRRLRALHRGSDLRVAVSLDEVGLATGFDLQSPQPRPRAGVERRVLDAARRAGVPLRWRADSGTGNSDHREIELAGMPGVKIGPRDGVHACRHELCDSWRQLRLSALGDAVALALGLL